MIGKRINDLIARRRLIYGLLVPGFVFFFFCAKLENSKSLIGELGYLGEKSLIENLEAYRTGSLGEYLSDKFIQQCKGASLGAFN